MPAAKGKQAISVVMPVELLGLLDAESQTRQMDRSSLIVSKLQAVETEGPWTQVMIRLDSHDRALAQMITALQDVLAAMKQSPTKAATVEYPVPATLEETYPELYAPKVIAPEPVVVTPVDEKKGWRPWRQ